MTGAGHLRSARPAPTRQSPSPSRLPQSRPQVPAPRPQPTTAVCLEAGRIPRPPAHTPSHPRGLPGPHPTPGPAPRTVGSPRSRPLLRHRDLRPFCPRTLARASALSVPFVLSRPWCSSSAPRSVDAAERGGLENSPLPLGVRGPGSRGAQKGADRRAAHVMRAHTDIGRAHAQVRAGSHTWALALRPRQRSRIWLVCPGAQKTSMFPRGMAVHTSSPTIQSLTLGKQDAENEGPQDCDDHESQDQEEGSLSPASRVPWDNTNGLLSSSLDPWARRTAPVTWLSPR